MKKMVDGFKIIKDGKIIDEFGYYVDSNNHASISNKAGCLFDGYKLEADEKWLEISKDMKMCESFGFTIKKGELKWKGV